LYSILYLVVFTLSFVLFVKKDLSAQMNRDFSSRAGEYFCDEICDSSEMCTFWDW